MRRPQLACIAPLVLVLAAGPMRARADEDLSAPESFRPPRGLDLRVTSEVRALDGSGNNTAHPDWGRAGTPLMRLMIGADYADGVGAPPQGMPESRSVSNAVAAQPGAVPNAMGVTDMVWQWGQFLDHDLDLTGAAHPAEPFDIPVPPGDPHFDPLATGNALIPMTRSSYVMSGGVRQQMNEITAFIDASHVYGSDMARARELRTLDGTGRLATSDQQLLPFNVNGFPNAPSTDPSFFLAGDVRANEQVGLTALHTLFVREHNWLARHLKRSAPHASGDEIYEMARAIVAAEIQVITYHEFLPLLLGPSGLAPYTGYDPTVNPGIDNAFSTAAYRFGHSMVSNELLRLKRNGKPIAQGHLPLAQSFFAPGEIIDGGGIEPILRGLVTQAAQEVDPFVVDGLRNFLFGPPGSGGFDLASLNIQRGRDHGMSRYNACRRALGLAARASFAEISSDPEIQSRLASVYANVEDVDLWVGGLAEDRLPGAMLGELFATVVADQFERLRAGDRFWYEVDFAPWMVNWLESQTLAGIIRRNTSIGDELQDDAFRVPPQELAEKNDDMGPAADLAVTFGPFFPNPARVGSRVALAVPEGLRDTPLDVDIYDVRGRRIRRLQFFPSVGRSTVDWDGRSTDGLPAAAGVYFVGVRGRGSIVQRRILLVD